MVNALESDKSGTQQNPFLLEDANQEAKVYYFFRVSNSRHQRKQQAMTATRTLLETQRVENARFKEQEEARKKKEKDDYVFFWPFYLVTVSDSDA